MGAGLPAAMPLYLIRYCEGLQAGTAWVHRRRLIHPAMLMAPLMATYRPTPATTPANNSDSVRFRGASSVAKRHATSPPATAPAANKAARRQSIKPEAA